MTLRTRKMNSSAYLPCRRCRPWPSCLSSLNEVLEASSALQRQVRPPPESLEKRKTTSDIALLHKLRNTTQSPETRKLMMNVEYVGLSSHFSSLHLSVSSIIDCRANCAKRLNVFFLVKKVVKMVSNVILKPSWIFVLRTELLFVTGHFALTHSCCGQKEREKGPGDGRRESRKRCSQTPKTNLLPPFHLFLPCSWC